MRYWTGTRGATIPLVQMTSRHSETTRQHSAGTLHCTSSVHTVTLNYIKIYVAYFRYRLRPRVLVDVSKIDTTVELYGGRVEFPICVAPTAFQRMAHKDGEVATAKGIL